jgi:uncharacterized protein YoxC
MDDFKDFDLSQLKKVDESGETTPVFEEKPVEETEVENAPEEETEVKENNTEEVVEETQEQPAEVDKEVETVSEETEQPVDNTEELQEDDSRDKLVESIDNAVKDLTGGTSSTIEELFEEYKSLRDSEKTSFKDDFIKDAVEFYNKTGSLTPYLEATSLNFEEMTDEKIMRHNLKSQNPTLSDRAIERLYLRDIINKYSLDADRFDEDEVELGKELLKADADKLRKTLVDEQKNFIQPESKPEDNSEAEAQQTAFIESVNTNKTTRDILENKRILVDYNDQSFSYEIENPEQLKDMALDSTKFFALFQDEKGTIDFDKWYKVASYALDPETYNQSLISHGVGLGQEKVVKDLKNPSKVTKSSPQYKEPATAVEGIIGEIMRGGNNVKIIK